MESISIEEQVKQFEIDTRRNAGAIHVFCRERGMSPIETRTACDWVVHCIKAAMRVIPND